VLRVGAARGSGRAEACMGRYARLEGPATVMNGQSVGGLLWPTLAAP
jgi:hypothetical protein